MMCFKEIQYNLLMDWMRHGLNRELEFSSGWLDLKDRAATAVKQDGVRVGYVFVVVYSSVLL